MCCQHEAKVTEAVRGCRVMQKCWPDLLSQHSLPELSVQGSAPCEGTFQEVSSSCGHKRGRTGLKDHLSFLPPLFSALSLSNTAHRISVPPQSCTALNDNSAGSSGKACALWSFQGRSCISPCFTKSRWHTEGTSDSLHSSLAVHCSHNLVKERQKRGRSYIRPLLGIKIVECFFLRRKLQALLKL